ncbi:MAG: DNA repair protein RecN [Gammaproteobacteria bacterium]|nr:DNA repair protein RecN [Gammaproteobacteria bacterium]
MLAFIQIHNFAIIDEAELELEEGLTVLTGETGAGKSILVDALGLALGDRADAGSLRHGATRGEIVASFQLTDDSAALGWLKDQELDAEGECMVRRTLTSNGRSRAFINSRAVPLGTLRELGEYLADIHGQHEHQSLVRPAVQRQILDHLGGKPALVRDVMSAFRDWSARRQELAALAEQDADRASRLELLQYQVKELGALAPSDGEMTALDDEHRRLASAGQLAEGVQQALVKLGSQDNDIDGASELLGKAERALHELAEIDPALGDAVSLVQEAAIQIGESVDRLQRYAESLEMDPSRLDWVEARIASLLDVGRKHRVEPSELPALAKRLADELELLESADARLEALEAELGQAEHTFTIAAGKLSRLRKRTARKMSDEISTMMQALGMQGGRFEVIVEPRNDAAPSEHGVDEIEFRVTANPGHPPGPLGKVASGGELSRISLAVQVIAADATPTGCLVFDEVDAGVGGGVAEIVGRRLRQLGKTRQVLCVTHLAQVASQAHHHVRVSKITDGKTTRTALKPLTKQESVEEIARMLGGVEITRRTREHAREMIDKAASGKA